MADKARILTAKALMRVSAGGFSNLVLDSLLEENHLEQRDRAFVSALFYGVLERRITLDTLIRKYVTQPFDKISPEVLETLRMGFYQILYMNSVPDNAAVNESVELVKNLGVAKASGFVNGVLRSFIRDGKKADFSYLKGIRRLSAEYSAPLWLCEKWCLEFGPQRTQKALRASIGAPPIYVRVNTEKITAEELKKTLEAEGISVSETNILPTALILDSAAPQNTKAYEAGLFHVQDISSQLCALAVGAKENERVLDVCAAPGGKSFTVAEYMKNTGELIACDLHPKRANLVKTGGERLGLTNISAKANDAVIYKEELGTFNRILCDVPCSGLGVIRRKPEIRFKKPEDLTSLPKIQYKIASTSARYLKDGGTLIYSTCTLSKEENEEVVRRLIEEDGLVPENLPEELQKYSSDGYSVTLLPGEINSDGFFFARLKKEVKDFGSSLFDL